MNTYDVTDPPAWFSMQCIRVTSSCSFLISRLAQDLREKRAAIIIQRSFRGYICRKRFVSIREAVLTIQCYTRGMFARRLKMHLLCVAKAKIIQGCWRRYKARKSYRNYKKTIIYLQSCVRRVIARRQLKQLKVGHLKANKNWYRVDWQFVLYWFCFRYLDRSTLCWTLQEAEYWDGEQNNSLATTPRRTGSFVTLVISTVWRYSFM